MGDPGPICNCDENDTQGIIFLHNGALPALVGYQAGPP